MCTVKLSYFLKKGVQNLYDRMERMQRFGPEFVDITWGAGGTSADLTIDMVASAQSVYGLETMMHLTCTNMPVEQIDRALEVSDAFWEKLEKKKKSKQRYIDGKVKWLSKHFGIERRSTKRTVKLGIL